ncbi:MAG: hypothetical protein ACE5K8_00220 [Candidatus Zixiibacteriota bacterium]
MKSVRNVVTLSILTTAAVLALPFARYTQATSIQGDGNIHISNLHEIDDDLYAFGENVTVDGLIKGDLVVGARDVFINGEVTESENIICYKLHHTGFVHNSLRAFANTITIDGRVGRSLMFFGYDCRIGKGASIERDVTIGGYSARLEGTVGGKATIWADRIYLSGEIEGDVELEGKQITISPPTTIKGNLTYTSEKEIDIDPSAGVTVLGKTEWKQPEQKPEKEHEDKAGAGLRDVVFEVSKLLAAFLFGIIVILVFRRYARESFEQLRTRFAVSVAAGFLTLLIVIGAVLILLVSVVFILIGLALISGNLAPVGALVLVLSILMVPITSFAAVSGGIVFYSGKILFALLVGYLLVKLFKSQPALLGKGQLLLGLIVLTLLFAVPYVGFLIYLLVTIIGAGGIVLGIKSCRPAVQKATGTSDLDMTQQQ